MPDAAPADGAAPDAPAPDQPFDTEDSIRTAVESVDLPYLSIFTITPDPSFAGTCPVVTSTATGWTAHGGCTDSSGTTFGGSESATHQPAGTGIDYTFDFQGFSAQSATWSVTFDGHVFTHMAPTSCGNMPGPNPLTADGLRITVSGTSQDGYGGSFPGAGRSVTLTYYGFRWAWDGACDPATTTASGRVQVEGQGSFDLDVSRQEVGTCAHDPLMGHAVFTGRDTATLTYDGATNCDGCIPYMTSTGLTGSLCWP